MTEVRARRKCGDEIQKIIDSNHPIDIHSIRRLTHPPLELKQLRQSLRLLRKKKKVDMLISSSRTFFYQPYRPLAQTIKQVSDDQKPLLKRQDWFHNTWCFYWESSIKRLFPDVEVIREHNIGRHGEAKELLLSDGKSQDLLPDLLLIFPNSKSQKRIAIGLEVERTRKSNERIIRKLNSYVNETRLDGVIYICDSARLAETIRMLYKNNSSTARRIRHYKNSFFLFSDCMSAGDAPFERIFLADGTPTNFNGWIESLKQ